MNLSRKALVVSLVLGVFLFGTFAWAYATFTKTFTDTYKVAKDSNLLKAKCALCHAEATKNFKKLNPYGADLQKAMQKEKAKELTAKILASVEKLDSDKDKAANIAEIKANTLPGDPKSCPKK